MPGSTTTPGHTGTRAAAPICIAFQQSNGVGSRDKQSFEAQWLAYALPCRRFARTLAGACARLGADAVRYSFIVADFHHLLLAGFTGAPARVLNLRRRGSNLAATNVRPAGREGAPDRRAGNHTSDTKRWQF